MSQSSWYQDWHNNPNHKVIHWFAFGLASIALIVFTRQDLGSFSRSLDELNPFHADMAEAMTVTVASDRVNIGAEYIMRRTDLPNQLIVPVGQTVELPADATYDYVEVGGTLRVSRTHDTTTRFTTMIILPGGTFDAGTQADPIPCGRNVEMVVRNVPIDTTKDPFQWGNSLVNFGRQTRVGCAKTSFVEASGSIAQGATTINLASTPSGWAVGDEVLIPDTVTPASVNADPRKESVVTIASISGSTITLSKGLDFAHPNILDPNGTLVLRPRVGNLTRNIWIHSENQNGTRGHTADIGLGATWDIRYNKFSGLGRTLNIPLEDTNISTGHIGTNQRGKYTEHHHHAESSVGSSDVGNVLIGMGTGGSKWGLAVHGTSDVLVQDNIAYGFPGAGFVTEDGNEVRDVFKHNLAVATIGNKTKGDANFAALCPGCEGTGFWLHGIQNTFDSNEAWNNYSGITLFNQNQPNSMYPSVPGGVYDTPVGPNSHYTTKPVLITNNITAGNERTGFESWATTDFQNYNLTSANNFEVQFDGVISEAITDHLTNPKFICESGKGSQGLHAGFGYTVALIVDGGGEIRGCSPGINGGGGGAGLLRMVGTTLQNDVNIGAMNGTTQLINVMHVPLGSNPHQYINVSVPTVPPPWNGTGPLPDVGADPYPLQRGSRWFIQNWQGTGKDYMLLSDWQVGNLPSWYSLDDGSNRYLFATPVKGLTMQQSWDTYGLALGGDTVAPSAAVTLDGVLRGFGRAGLTVSLPAPRAVVTSPTTRQSAVVSGGAVHIYALLTGDYNAASDQMYYSVDGVTQPPIGPNIFSSNPDDRSFGSTQVSPGLHTITTWRTQVNNPTVELAGSRMSFNYCVGTGCLSEPSITPTPSPTPTPTPVPVPPPGPTTPPPPVNPPPVTPPPVTPPPVTPPPVTPPPPTSTTYDRTITINQFDGRPLTKTITGTISILNSSRVLIKSYPFTSTAEGSINVTIDVSPIVGFISIKAAPFLQKIVSIDLNATAPSIVPKLFIGDVNQDNIVNSIDFSAMNAKWFMADTATDLNQDGLVNTLDYSLMNKNWFVQGDR